MVLVVTGRVPDCLTCSEVGPCTSEWLEEETSEDSSGLVCWVAVQELYLSYHNMYGYIIYMYMK